jgi:itaconyl-CoA hydratase
MAPSLPIDGYEDFSLNDVFETPAVTITEAHLVAWSSLTGDWYPLHVDEEYAKEKSPFGRRVAHGPFIYALCVGLLERANVLGTAVLAWLGTDEMRATQPVFIGDTIHLRVTVVEQRASSSNPDRGVVGFLYEAINQDGDSVLRFRTNMMIRSRDAA